MSQRLTAVFSTFENLTDPRVERTRRHKLFDLVVVALCGTIAGGDSCADIERFGIKRLAWLRTFLPLANGIASHDTFGRLFARLDPANSALAFNSGWRTWAGKSAVIDELQCRRCSVQCPTLFRPRVAPPAARHVRSVGETRKHPDQCRKTREHSS